MLVHGIDEINWPNLFRYFVPIANRRIRPVTALLGLHTTFIGSRVKETENRNIT